MRRGSKRIIIGVITAIAIALAFFRLITLDLITESLRFFPTSPSTLITHRHIQSYETERKKLLANFEPIAWSTYNLSPPDDHLKFEPEQYKAKLETFIHTYFADHPPQHRLLRSVSNLEYHLPRSSTEREREGEGIPKDVYTTCKGGVADLPAMFLGWEKHLGGDGWSINVADDEDMEDWFEDLTHGNKAWKRVWESLAHPILKSDLLRYLVILIKGGIYSDSDTQPHSHPYLWAANAYKKDLTNENLPRISRAMAESTRTSFGSYPLNSTDDYEHDNRHGIQDRDTSMVLSVECDQLVAKHTCNRSLQFVQWTFMAKPFHPALLDLLASIVSTMETAISDGFAISRIDAAKVTGPGPFTDSILRYLIIAHGISPYTLQHLQSPARAGDILVLPSGAFTQYLKTTPDWGFEENGYPEGACVAHDFYGRWKDES